MQWIKTVDGELVNLDQVQVIRRFEGNLIAAWDGDKAATLACDLSASQCVRATSIIAQFMNGSLGDGDPVIDMDKVVAWLT